MAQLSVIAGVVCASALLLCAGAAATHPACDAFLQLEGGRVCGAVRRATGGRHYRSFRGVPYASQPLGERRFRELQPLEPWEGTLIALQEGPICPQNDVFYHQMMSHNMSEACIYANIHIPLPVEPDLTTPYETGSPEDSALPILVMIHGGGFAYGSGNADVYGPEMLVSRDVIVITFNYRLNVLGFLSLGSAGVPGNAGLRDMVTLLRWVRRNALAIGGHPDDVTIMGQSAGAVAAHLLTLSPAARGLFKRAIIMSGTALPVFYAITPNYAAYIANMFLNKTLERPSADVEDIRRQLVRMPLETIMAANQELQATMGITAFYPVIESPLPGVTRIIDADPEALLRSGRGKDIPLLIGYTDVECESFRPAFESIGLMQRIALNNITLVPLNVVFENIFKPEVLPPLVEKIHKAYFDGNVTMDKWINLCTQSFFEYPALKVAQYRRDSGGAPAFMYRFSYDAEHSVIKEAFGLNYTGAAHVEDMSYVFQVNSVDVTSSAADEAMKQMMTSYVVNFIRCNDPSSDELNCPSGSWPPVSKQKYQLIESPNARRHRSVTQAQRQLINLFDGIRRHR